MRERIRAIWTHLRTEHTDPRGIAAAVFTGLFLGVVPLYGVQTILCLAAAQLLRLNKITVVLAAQISIPPIAPFLIAGGITVGEFVRFGHLGWPDPSRAFGMMNGPTMIHGFVFDLFLSCLIGDVILGVIIGGIGAAIAYRFAASRQNQKV